MFSSFQDGATQLQFCSDKCLNQYKMHIFCRETQAHLDLNPHLVNASSSSNLITPDLWLKNCKSRSASPTETERSASPNTETKTSPPPKAQKSPLPLITIAPTAKLMKQKRTSEDPPIQKSPESKTSRNKMNLRKRRTSKCSATVTSQSQTRQRTSTPKAQDLRMCSPSEGSSPGSTIGTAINSPPHPMIQHPPPPFPNPMFSMPPPVFLDNHPHMGDMRHPMPGGMFPPRMPFMPRHMQMHERPRLPPPLNFPQPLGQPPPVTVLVPYPVILPLPIPIPIPMPLSAFLQAHLASKVKTEARTDDAEGPLDFTMNRRDEPDETNSANSEPIETETQDVTESTSEVDDRIEVDQSENAPATGEHEPEQTLPKFKITRLGNKMAKIVAKAREPSESSRPLRKRRRLVEASEDEALIPKTRNIVQV